MRGVLRRIRNGYEPSSQSAVSPFQSLAPPSRIHSAMDGGSSAKGRGSAGRWWHGALVGAICALIACAIARELLATGGARGGDPIEEPKRHGEPCPVFNGVTGETKVPEESPPKRIEQTIKPGKPYPIRSEDWASRVYKAKAARSRESMGALPEEVGRAALSKRVAAQQSRQQQRNGGGTAAVLTLLVADVEKPQPFASVLGQRQSWGSAPGAAAGGAGWVWEEVVVCAEDASALDEIVGSRGGGEGEAWREARERGAVKLVPCRANDERRAGEVSLACAAADVSVAEWVWLPGPAAAEAIATAAKGKSTVPGKGLEVVAELSRLATSTGADVALGLRGWVRTQSAPQPKRRRRSLTPEGVVGDTRGDVPETEQPVPEPEQSAPEPERRPEGKGLTTARRLGFKSFRRKSADVWEFVGGAGAGGDRDGDGGSGVAEVDALTDALFVRGAHLKHACALLRGTSTNGGGVSTASGGKGRSPSRENGENDGDAREQRHRKLGGGDDARPERKRDGATAVDKKREAADAARMNFTKLPAVSYVLRKTLGVRSYAAGGLLPWGGPGVGRGRWGERNGEETLGSGEASVPGSQFLPWECLSRSRLEPVLLSVTSLRDLRAIKPLLEGFQTSGVYDPYIVLSGSAALSPSVEFRAELETATIGAAAAAEGTGGRVLDLGRLGEGSICGVLEVGRDHGTGGESLVAQAQWAALLSQVSPVAVIAVSGTDAAATAAAAGRPDGFRQGWGGADTEGERAARRACGQAEAEIAYILLPEEDVPHSLWLARLAPVALSSWARPRFSVSVITNDRPRSLRRLLGSLRRSRLFGDQMAVDFYVESSADDETLEVADAFSSEWGDRGLVQTHFRVLKGGLIRAVSESFFPSDRHHHAFLLEDDIELSPHFYAWAKWATLTYQYGLPSDFMKSMYGVSLYTPRVDELGKQRRVYDSNKLVASQTSGAKYSPYLHQLPCSWGALYFAETWREYRLYLGARLREDHVSVNIEGSRTNKWKTSWKRYFIEMAYQAQYYMLYPNFYNQTSFATNWLEVGEHIKVDTKGKGNDEKPEPPSAKGDSKHLPKDYTVPLMEDKESLMDPLPGRRLPPLESLPRMDILNRFSKTRVGEK